MNNKEIGNKIRQRRKVLGLTIRELADISGMSKTTISQIEQGTGNPTLEILHRIFTYLNLEITVEIKHTYK